MRMILEEHVNVSGFWQRSYDLRALGARGMELAYGGYLEGSLTVYCLEGTIILPMILASRMDNAVSVGRVLRFPLVGASCNCSGTGGTTHGLWIRLFDEPVAPSGMIALQNTVNLGVAPAGSTGWLASAAPIGAVRECDMWVVSTQTGTGRVRLRMADQWPDSVVYYTTAADVPQRVFEGLMCTYLSTNWTNTAGVAADFYWTVQGRLG